MRSYPPRATSAPPAPMSSSLNLKLVEPRLATRTSMESKDEGGRMKDERKGAAADVLTSSFRVHPSSLDSVAAAAARAVAGQQVGVGPRDHVGGDQLADPA